MSDITNKVTLSKDEFYSNFIKPLEELFGFKTYWNSKTLLEIGLKPITGTYSGQSYIYKDGCPIVLKYKKNTYHMLSTLIHEYSHSYLHGKQNELGCDLDKNIMEIEAETVTKKVFEKLDLEYLNQWYIPHYFNSCKANVLESYEEIKYERDEEIDWLADNIVNLYKDNISLIKKLNKEKVSNKVKYTVTCPCCNRVWEYKRKAKIIDKNAKGFWCPVCSEKKTKDKLIVQAV